MRLHEYDQNKQTYINITPPILRMVCLSSKQPLILESWHKVEDKENSPLYTHFVYVLLIDFVIKSYWIIAVSKTEGQLLIRFHMAVKT